MADILKSNNSDKFSITFYDQILISESINTEPQALPQPLMCTSFYQKSSSTARSYVQNKDSVAKKNLQ